MIGDGLSPQEIAKLYGREDSVPWTHILEFGSGWLVVRRLDGKVQKRVGGSISWRYNNPGNLKYGDFAREFVSIGDGWGGHAVFPQRFHGHEAKKALLFKSNAYRDLNLWDAIARYAPSDDHGKGAPKGGNQPKNYVAYIVEYAKIDPDKIMKTYTSEEQDKILLAVLDYEGWKPGKVEFVEQ